jgi:hypothetical protein
MKILSISTVLCIILFKIVSGQGIVSEDNTWNVLMEEFGFGQIYYNTQLWVLDGDSVVNAQDYKILWYSYYTSGGWFPAGLLREDSNRVYYITSDVGEGLLYDFNAEVGDTCSIINWFLPDEDFDIYITSIDTVEYFGIERRRWFLTDDSGDEDYWIEGIGSSYGPIQTMMRGCYPTNFFTLLCYHHSGTLLFRKEGYSDCNYTNVGIDESMIEEQIIIYPNPARDKIEVRSDEFGIEKIAVFDLQGRKLIEKHFPLEKNNAEILVSELLPGTYLCIISAANQEIVRKILIQ